MKISVIGAGVMGARVTEVLIKGGHDVVMIDTNRDHATGSLNRIVADLAIGIEKGKLTKEESDAALARITISNMCSDAAGSTLVLECINEHLDDKVTLLKQLDTILDEDCILGTNTSALPISEIARAVPHHTADLVGLDDILSDLSNMYEETGDPKYHPHPLLRKMVRAGLLGQKSGRGFFTYKYPFGPEVPGGELKIK